MISMTLRNVSCASTRSKCYGWRARDRGYVLLLVWTVHLSVAILSVERRGVDVESLDSQSRTPLYRDHEAEVVPSPIDQTLK